MVYNNTFQNFARCKFVFPILKLPFHHATITQMWKVHIYKSTVARLQHVFDNSINEEKLYYLCHHSCCETIDYLHSL